MKWITILLAPLTGEFSYILDDEFVTGTKGADIIYCDCRFTFDNVHYNVKHNGDISQAILMGTVELHKSITELPFYSEKACIDEAINKMIEEWRKTLYDLEGQAELVASYTFTYPEPVEDDTYLQARSFFDDL